MRSCRTCSPVNQLYCLVLFTGCLIKRDRKHDIPALKLRRNYVNSRSFWNPGLYLKVGASSYSNKKTELSKHTNMTTKISCLDKPRFLNKNPPTQKDPLKKKCSKQQVYNLEAARFQMWSRQQRPQGGSPQKHNSCKE